MGEIYKVTNNNTGEIYIGATTTSFEERKKDHIRKSVSGLGHDFQNAITTYGLNSFTWEQIDTAFNIDELAKKEIEYIQKFNSINSGYNRDKGGGFQKTIYKYNLNGTLSSTFSNLTLAAITVEASKKQISRACWSVNHVFKGFLWSYEYKEPFTSESDMRKKEVSQYSLEDKFITKYLSVSEASNNNNVSKSGIAKCCRGERLTCGGYKWYYSSTNDISNNN